MAERTHVSVPVRPIHATALHVGGACSMASPLVSGTRKTLGWPRNVSYEFYRQRNSSHTGHIACIVPTV